MVLHRPQPAAWNANPLCPEADTIPRKRTPFPKVVGAAVLVSRNLIPFLAGLPARAARFIMPA
jgi:hypothetical protein